MNKKMILLLVLFLFLAIEVNAGLEGPGFSSLSLTWLVPATTPYELKISESLEIQTRVTCLARNCPATTATLQYCKGTSCSNYADITDSGELQLTKGETATQEIGNLSGSTNISWPITWPESPSGAVYNLKIIGATSLDSTELTGRQLQVETITSAASILSPPDGNEFFVGTTIDFKSNIFSGDPSYTISWDSNKDSTWSFSDENFSSNELNIGDHNITLTLTDATGETKDSVFIRIKPITKDVFSISDFQIIKVNPTDRFSVNGLINVKAKVNYFLSEEIDAKAFFIISNGTTNQAIYGPSIFYLHFTNPSFEEFDLNVDLSNYAFRERENYKVEFLVVSNEVESSPEYFVDPVDEDSAYWDDGEPYFIPLNQIPEQNKANNSGFQIIELGPATLPSITAPETHPIIILFILFAILIVLKKK